VSTEDARNGIAHRGSATLATGNGIANRGVSTLAAPDDASKQGTSIAAAGNVAIQRGPLPDATCPGIPDPFKDMPRKSPIIPCPPRAAEPCPEERPASACPGMAPKTMPNFMTDPLPFSGPSGSGMNAPSSMPGAMPSKKRNCLDMWVSIVLVVLDVPESWAS
jgi:hypothetical protein